ncbi:MAG: AraC family transcriptional regulator [Lachnospiraceae bacterium]|nr:AraC family transcriptional regulator [Lachnospiraceae bacterium]
MHRGISGKEEYTVLYEFSVFSNSGYIDLGMYQFGHEQCEPGQIFGPAARNHYIFHYVISGSGMFEYEDKKGMTQFCRIRRGQGFLLIPGHVTTYFADNVDPWQYIWIEFDGLRVKEALDLAGFSTSTPVYQPVSKVLRDNMYDEMRYIVSNKNESALHLTGHLYLFFDYLVRSSSKKQYITGSRLREFYIKEAISYIERNYQKDITVEEIAENAGLNRSYFGKIFRESVGKPPQTFLLQYRMIKASEMLRLTDLSVAEIGMAVGYQNQLHFSRAFKGVYGSSPREYRKKNRIIEVEGGTGRRSDESSEQSPSS